MDVVVCQGGRDKVKVVRTEEAPGKDSTHLRSIALYADKGPYQRYDVVPFMLMAVIIVNWVLKNLMMRETWAFKVGVRTGEGSLHALYNDDITLQSQNVSHVFVVKSEPDGHDLPSCTPCSSGASSFLVSSHSRSCVASSVCGWWASVASVDTARPTTSTMHSIVASSQLNIPVRARRGRIPRSLLLPFSSSSPLVR